MYICHINPREACCVRPIRPAIGVTAVIRMSAVVAVIKQPSLWPTALRAMHRLRPTGLNVPVDYLRFRQQTQRGGTGTAPMEPTDLVDFLKWARSARQVMG
jgi:hypothetical protein